MKTVLMVAETPSLASAVAKILSDGLSASKKSLSSACLIHKWHGQFFGELVTFKMTSVCSHVTTVEFEGEYKNWISVEPEELFYCPIAQKETYPKEQFIDMLAREASGVDFLVLWFNNDNQSENRCFKVIQAVKPRMKSSSDTNRLWRAKFSSITPKNIKAAMDRLDIPKHSKALSVDAREEIDLRIRCAFTSFQTKYFQEKYIDLDTSLISYDLCQIPTLGFCVQRHDEIQRFKSVPYFVIQVTIQSKDGKNVILSWEKGKCFDLSTSSSLFKALKMQKIATVVSITHQVESKLRPLPLNSLELMQSASIELKMGPLYTLKLADQLYIQGYISYPRTESSCYSDNFDAYDMMRNLLKSSEYGKKMCKVLNNNLSEPRNGQYFSDQFPITPTKLASPNELDGDSWKLYDFIVRRFVATFANDLQYYSHTVNFLIGTENFIYNWKTLINPGFTVIYPGEALLKNKLEVSFNCDDKLFIQDIRLIDKMESPPGYLTESELITTMEKHKIGSHLSIATIIDSIIQRNYITVTTGRQLVPTNWGIVLVHGYQKVDKQLVEPIIHSTIEDQLSLIANGEANYNKIVGQIINAMRQKYSYFVKNINAMNSIFACAFTSFSATGKAFSRCGKCHRYMILILEKKSRLHCLNCDETYYLPKNGSFKMYKELKCPLDDFELITWSMGNKGKSFPLCPYCYNQPGFINMDVHSGCNQCIHPTCPEGLYMNGIASCSQCEHGILVLDPSSRPKWKVECNKCDVVFRLFEDAHKITIEKNKECYCGAQLLKIEYKEERSRLPRYLTEMTGCIFCSDEFDNLIERLKTEKSEPVNILPDQKKEKLKNRRSRRGRRRIRAKSPAINK